MNKLQVACAAALAALPAVAQSAVVTFNNLPTSGPFYGNGAPFTTYTEAGFTVSAPAGQYVDYTTTPTPSILTGGNNGIVTALLTITGTGLFTFASFDAFASGAAAAYTVTGYLGAAQLYASSGTVGIPVPNGTFSTFGGFSSAVVDRVTISTTASYQLALDNITTGVAAVAAVPEPASWALMVGGFGLVGGALRQRRAVQVRIA